MEKEIIKQQEHISEDEALIALYEQILASGGMVREMTMPKGYLAAVGDIEDFRTALGLKPDDEETEITYEMLDTLPAMLLFAHPGTGDTRVEAVADGLKGWQEGKESAKTGRILHGSFEIAGGRMSAYMPASDHEKQQWTIEYVKDGEVVFTEYAEMTYAPVFGPDAEDVNCLNQRIEEIIAQRSLE